MRKGVKALILINRPSDRAETALANLKQEKEKLGVTTEFFSVDCDLRSFESVHNAAEEVNKVCEKFGGLHVLANNAGIGVLKDERTEDGYDVQMQINHLSHFLLIKLLFPSLMQAYDRGDEVRVCHHSSRARYLGREMDAKFYEKAERGALGGNSFSASMERYNQSKLANAAFTMAFHEELEKNNLDITRFKSVVADPGVSGTDAMSNTMKARMSNVDSFKINMFSLMVRFLIKVQSPADGALPFIHACFAAEVESGDLFVPEKGTVGQPMRAIHKMSVAKGYKIDESKTLNKANQQTVWSKSVSICGDIFHS